LTKCRKDIFLTFKDQHQMTSWHTKELGDGIMADGPAEEIKAAFLRSFQAAGGPLEMAVFTRLESEGRLHCEVVAYFSPAAQEVAKAFEAEPCPRPAREGLGLLAGDAHCWPVLFPEASS
jgi:hypothetical protein